MVINEFFLNQVFFKELQSPSQQFHIQTLKNIHEEINKFGHPIIFYNSTSQEFVQFQKKIYENKMKFNRNLKVFILTQMRKIISDQTQNGDLVKYCLLNNDSCLLSISNEESWHEKIYRDPLLKMETQNVFDVKSFNEYYESEKIQDYISEIIEAGGKTNKIGHLDILYPNLNSVEISSRFKNDYCSIGNVHIRDKTNKIFNKLFIGKKRLDEYDYHTESTSVKQDPKLKEQRKVTFNGKIKYIYMHLKLDTNWSIYAEVIDNTLFLGQITDHLDTKNF